MTHEVSLSAAALAASASASASASGPRMENKGFERESAHGGCCTVGGGGAGAGGGGVELSDVAVGPGAGGPPSPSPPPSPLVAAAVAPPQLAVNGNGAITCSDHCQSLHLQHQKYYREKTEPPAPESPWHHLKTIFLVGTLVFLALWVLVYTLLSQLAVF